MAFKAVREEGLVTIDSHIRYKVITRHLNAWFGTKHALKDTNLDIEEKSISSFLGPSGCVTCALGINSKSVVPMEFPFILASVN